jgi:hypothetical protein
MTSPPITYTVENIEMLLARWNQWRITVEEAEAYTGL